MGELLFASADNAAARCLREVHEASRWLLGDTFLPARTTMISIPHSDPDEAMPQRRPHRPDKHAEVARLSLKGVMGDMLLPDGAHLKPSRKVYHDNQNKGYGSGYLVVGGRAVLNEVCISAGGAVGPKTRFYAPSRAEQFKKHSDVCMNEESDGRIRVVWPDEPEWNGSVGLTFWYQHKERRAAEQISVVTCHDKRSDLPAVQSQIAVPISGTYIPFTQRMRPARSEEEVRHFLTVVRDLHAPQDRL